MKKEASAKKSKLWIVIVAILVLLLAAGGGVLAFVLGGQGEETPAATVSGPRADLYWNIDREFYTANSQTGLSTREADENGQFKMKFAFNGEIVELVIIDKKLVNIIDTQDVVGLQFDENGVVIGQINVRDLATEVGKKVYVKKATDDMIIANSSMAMNGMELNLKLGQYSEIYDLREGSETYGKKITPAEVGVMDCMTVYANADGENTHFFVLSAAIRSKIYWRANLWVSSTVNRGGLDPDENGVWTLPFYCEGELVQVKTKDVELVDYYADLGKHSGFTGLIFDDDGYAIDIINAAVGVAGQQTFFALDVEEINGTYVKLKAYWSTSGVQTWEGNIPAETPIYNVSSWAYSEGVMGQKLTVNDLKVGDRITMFSDMDGNPIEIGLTLRRVDLKPMFNNSSKYDAATRSTTRVKDEDGYWVYTFINEKGISKYKTKDQKLANFIDSYPERVFGIVTKGDKLVKAYEYDCIYGQVRFSTALYVDSINGTIISCTDQRKANAYTAVLSEDYKVLDISGDSKQWGQKISLQVGDCMISFRNRNKEVCMIYVTKRSMGGKLYVNTTPNTSRSPITVDENGEPLDESKYYWQYEMTDINGKKVVLKLPVGKKKDGVYANKYLQSRIDGATQGVIALEVSGKTIKDAHTPGNMASGNAVGTVIITKAGTTEFEYKTAAKPNDEASIYPGWTGDEGLKKINLSATINNYRGEKLSGGIKVNDVYYMVRNRANETVALFLTSRGLHNDMFFVKNPQGAINGETTRTPDANGYYVFNVMYQGKPATVRTKDSKLAAQLDSKRTGAALKLDKTERPFTFTAVADYTGTGDAYASAVSNWDVSAISGSNVTLKLNIPTTSTEIGETKKLNIKGAKIYNISPDAGDDFGKTTKLQKNDRVRIYTDKNGKVTYVLVTVRNGLKTALCEHCNKKVTWNPITATSGMGTGSAHYYIFGDMDVYGQWAVSGDNTNKYDVVVDLNGKTVFNKGNNSRTFMVAYEGKSLTLMDSVGGATVKSYGNADLTNKEGGNAGVIQVSYGATLNILGGTYQLVNEEGKIAPKQGGVLFSWSEGDYARNTVNIKGGTLIGGEILHPNRTNGKDPLMSSAWSYGGTLYGQKTDFTMTGGTVIGGHADRGGNVYLGSTATFTMTGGTIENGIAKNRGGNFYAATGSTITIDGGIVTGGKIQGIDIDYVDAATGDPKTKHTGQQGGNITGHVVNLISGEITNGTAKTTGGNIFLLGSGNALNVSGGKIAGGTAGSGGGNVYVYGGEGLVNVTGGEIDASGVTIGKDTDANIAAAASVTGGKIGNISLAADCGIVVGGDAKIDRLGLSKTSLPIGITELSSTAKIYVAAAQEGPIAKAAKGSEDLDISAYANKQICSADKQMGNITFETIEGINWLSIGTKGNRQEVYAQIAADAVAMTTEGVFDVAEGAEAGVVEAECPYCAETVLWAPLTASVSKLNETEYDHFYLAADLNLAGAGRFYVEAGEICVHLNGKTLEQGATANSEAAFKVSGGATLNIMGNGTVTGYGTAVSSVTNWTAGAIDARGTVNILGGTYMSTAADRPAVGTWNGTGLINMYAGTITGATAADGTADGSSSVRVRAGAFNMYGGTITGGKAKYGGNVAINGGTFTMDGGVITGGTATRGGNVFAAGGTFNLVSGTVSNGTNTNNLGGNFYITGGTVNIKGGEVLNGTGVNSGGSFGMASASGKLDISGGVIDGGTTVNTGGLIYVYNGSLNISGGELKNGSAKNGGLIGIDASSTGTFTISGGTFSGGTASAAGGLILLNNTATITGGTFTNGTAANANGVNVGNGKSLTLGAITGTLDVKLNTNGTLNALNGAKTNVEFGTNTSKLVLADDLAEGTVITIDYAASDEAPLTEANTKAADYIANGYVVSANAARALKVNGENQIFVASMQTAMNDLKAVFASELPEGKQYHEAYCPVCGELAQWVPATAETATLDSGDNLHYYFAEDITGTRFATTSNSGKTVCVHLNGKTVNLNSTGNAIGTFRVNAGSALNIMDGTDNAGTVIGPGYEYNAGTTASPNMLYGGGAIDARGTVSIYGGTFKTSRADRPAVAIFGTAGDAQTVNMYGGKIVRDEAIVTTTASATSSLVRLYAASQSFNMFGGEITGGMATNGGNVRMQGGAFNLSGGTISGGVSANLGGNICVRGGTFTMTGGTVADGTTAASGGNFGLVSGTLDIQGGTVKTGTAVNGGMVYVYGGTLKISGGEISENVGKGGAILIAGGTNTITGGTYAGNKLDDNTTARDITVNASKTLTIGNTLAAKIYCGGTVTAQNGTVATVELASAGRIALAADVAEGTKITVIAAATQTIATIENAADYLTYFEAGVTGATIGVKADTTNEIEIVIPVAE